MAVEDAVRARGKRKQQALAYLASEDFLEDCRLINIDPDAIGKMVIEMLNEDESGKEVTRLKRKVRKR
jgi:hypothetical protein